MKVLVVAAGKSEKNFLEERISSYDYLVAVDGGLKVLESYEVDLFVGDVDSVEKDAVRGKECYFLHREKDVTDLEAAIDLLIERGFKEIDVFGAYGSRIDHVMTTCLMISRKPVKITLIDPNNYMFAMKESFVLEKKEGFYFSLIPLEEVVLSIRGSKYDIEKRRVSLGETLLVSNEFKEDKVYVNLEKGRLLVVYSRD